MSNADDDQTSVRIRRVPKFSVFIVLGAVVGELVTIILVSSFPIDPTVGFAAVLGYLSIYGLTAGVLVGAVVAIILDRVLSRRAKTVTATVARLEPDDDPRE
jgi:hypothetical protein